MLQSNFSLFLTYIHFLIKSLQILPVEIHGFKVMDLVYRERY